MKSLEVLAGTFVAHLETAMITEPRKTTLDDPTQCPQAAAVFRADAGQQRKDATRTACCDVLRRAIRTIAQRHLRLLARTSARTGHMRHRVEQSDGGLRVMHIGGRDPDHQGNAEQIGQDMAFAAFFRPVCRVRTGVRPQKPRGRWRCP